MVWALAHGPRQGPREHQGPTWQARVQEELKVCRGNPVPLQRSGEGTVSSQGRTGRADAREHLSWPLTDAEALGKWWGAGSKSKGIKGVSALRMWRKVGCLRRRWPDVRAEEWDFLCTIMGTYAGEGQRQIFIWMDHLESTWETDLKASLEVGDSKRGTAKVWGREVTGCEGGTVQVICQKVVSREILQVH